MRQADSKTNIHGKAKRLVRNSIPKVNDECRAELIALYDLEAPIRDLERAAQIAFLMTMHDSENPDGERLGLFAVEQVERLSGELREQFYSIGRSAVQS